ncbi:MAG: HIT domain-containing protein [Dehalococcoidia bacterium]|nr:HIT domain-containing protein [Dehalococcoidia bacterium]
MSERCIFCDIVAGTAPASVVHEDERTLAFMDLHQFHPGHVLVVPKAHRVDARELEDDLAGAVMLTVVRIARAVTAAFEPEGISISHAIGEAAGQEVPHAHFHVWPRYFEDGLLRVYLSKSASPPRDELDEQARRIRERL